MDSHNSKPLTSFDSDDKPREKLLKQGAGALTNKELIAILLRVGTKGKNVIDLASEILRMTENNLLELSKKDVVELSKIKGMGLTKATTLSAALELGNRKAASNTLQKPIADNINKVGKYLQHLYADYINEVFGILLLDSRLRIIKEKVLHQGSISSTIVDKRMIFYNILINNASGFILFHNHPSGSLEISEWDKTITQDVQTIAKQLNIAFHDHIIVSQEGFKSILRT